MIQAKLAVGIIMKKTIYPSFISKLIRTTIMPLPLPLIIIDECTLHEHKPAELSQKSKNRWNLGDWFHRN